MFSIQLKWKTLVAGGLLAILAGTAGAADWQVANVNVLRTSQAKNDPVLGTGTADQNLNVFQFEYFAGLKYGDIYVDAEVFDGQDVGGKSSGSFGGNSRTQNLIVLNPRLSLSKTFGVPLEFGPISDVSLISRFERGSYGNFESNNYGASLNFKVPGFMWFESGILHRDTNFYKDAWLWRSVLVSNPLELAGQKFHFNLLSLVNSTTTARNGTEIFLRPDFLWEIDAKGTFQAGIRYEMHRYQLDGSDYKRNTPFLMFKWNL